MAGLSRGQRNARWIEDHCLIPEGKLVGKPFKLSKQQKKWLRQIYDTPTRRFILSMARKQGKTAFAACLLLLHLVGPEARPNSQLYSAAQSREQAGILFSLAAKMVRLSPELSTYVGVRDTAKQLYCAELGTLFRALSADASTAYGLSPVFIVHDELGQVRGPRSELFEALETATGAQEEPLSVVISTQAPTDADLLSLLIDDAQRGEDPRTKVILYSADEDEDPFSEKAIRQAAPHYDLFMNQQEVKDQAAAASRMPSREAAYRNLVLNQRVNAINPFVSRNVWTSCGAEPDQTVFLTQSVYLGLDLSARNDLTAAVAVAQDRQEHRSRPADRVQQGQHRRLQLLVVESHSTSASGRPASAGRPERVCWTMRVRPEKLDEYKARHREVWPEMLAALRRTGWSNYSLFLDDDGLLIAYLETDDFEAAQAAMEETDVNARWQAEMAEFLIRAAAADRRGLPP